jgi:hypothetical protein
LLILLGAAPAAAAPGWLDPTDLSAVGKDALDPVVVMDDAGGTVAIWEREGADPFKRAVQVSTRSPGGGFSAPIDLAVPAQDPQIALTPAGEAIAAWWHFETDPIEFEKSHYVLEVSTRPPGGSFSPPVDVGDLPPNIGSPGAIRIAVNEDGDVALAWASRGFPEQSEEEKKQEEEEEEEVKPDPVDTVEAVVRPAGGGFTAPQVVTPQPFEEGKSAAGGRVAIDAAGNAIVIWAFTEKESPSPPPPPERTIEAAVRSAGGGGFGPPEPVSESGVNVFAPDVAMDASGTAVAVWSKSDGEEIVVQASVRPPGGAFTVPPDDISTAGEEAVSPDVEAPPGGGATVIWSLLKELDWVIEASDRPVGGSFSTPETIAASAETPRFPTLALNSDGDALVAWSSFAGAEQVLRAAVRSGGGGFSDPVDVSAPTDEFLHADGAVAGTGDRALVWARSNGSHDIVQAAGYDANPPELRSLSVPSAGTVGEPVTFSVTPFDIWPGVATSFSFGDGEKAQGASVSHAYASPGTYRVTATATDAVGSTASAAGSIAIEPSYAFRIVKKVRILKKGEILLRIEIPGPGRVTASGRMVKRRQRERGSAGVVTLRVSAKGRALKRLGKKGNARVRLQIAFAPDGGTRTATRRILVVLVKKPKKSRGKSNPRAKRHRATALR